MDTALAGSLGLLGRVSPRGERGIRKCLPRDCWLDAAAATRRTDPASARRNPCRTGSGRTGLPQHDVLHDPDNPHFADSLHNSALQRHIVHEVHHCLRMAGPGYGWTLGEALVSEGLAGQFVAHLLGSAAEPWERAFSLEALQTAPVPMGELEARYYDHSAWFFGTGDKPRWLGYALGYQMVGRWLASVGEPGVEAWLNVSAQEVMAVGLKEGLLSC